MFWIANEGQWQGDFQFKCEVGSTIYYVTPQGMTIDLRSYVGADGNPPAPGNFDPFAERGFSEAVPRRKPQVRGHVIQIHYWSPPASGGIKGGLPAIGQNKPPHYSNYFLGRDSTKWRSRVGHYENVIVPEVWPGIDIEYRADQQGVETIYHVKPGANPAQIQMEYLGLDAPLRVDAQGNLILSTSLGDVKEKAPFAFQQDARVQKRVDAGFQVIDATQVGYDVGAFDTGKELVVDPLIYSTFFTTGPVDGVRDIAIDVLGNKIITGRTSNPEFPITPGAYWQDAPSEFGNAFLSKLNHRVDSLLYSTYFPIGSNSKLLAAEDGSAWCIGWNYWEDFPLTGNAVDSISEDLELAIVHISSTGDSLLFASFWGGNNQDYVSSVEFDRNGLIYVSGTTRSTDLYTSEDALSRTLPEGRNAMLFIIDPTDYSIRYSTYFPTTITPANTHGGAISLLEPGRFWWCGGTQTGGLPITPDAFQPEFIDTSGWERTAPFFCLLNVFTSEIEYCSYWGNMEGEWGDEILNVLAIDSDRVLINGSTRLPDYSLPPGGFQQFHAADQRNTFIVRFSRANQIEAGTFLGAQGAIELGISLLLEDSSVVLAGTTEAADFPLTPDADDSTHGGGEFIPSDIAIARLSPDLSTLRYGSYLGGSQMETALDIALENNTVWVVGETESWDFTTTPDAMYPTFDAVELGFVSGFEFLPSETHQPNSSAVVQAPSMSAYPNPFNPTTTLEFTLPSTSNVELTVHDILGREVTHENLGRLTAGQHVIHINGSEWSSGIYFATLKPPARSQTTKLLLLR